MKGVDITGLHGKNETAKSCHPKGSAKGRVGLRSRGMEFNWKGHDIAWYCIAAGLGAVP